MANAIYPKYRTALLAQSANSSLAAGVVKALLVSTTGGTPYTYSAAHQFLSDIPVGARQGTAGTLANKTFGVVADGVFDADDAALGTPAAAAQAIVLYIDTGVEGTSRLVEYLDTGVGGLPAAAGGAVTAQWNAAGIIT